MSLCGITQSFLFPSTNENVENMQIIHKRFKMVDNVCQFCFNLELKWTNQRVLSFDLYNISNI